MLKTNWRELLYAVCGAVIGCALPIFLHFLILWTFGDGEAWGMPIAVFSLPGLFLGAIVGAAFAKKV